MSPVDSRVLTRLSPSDPPGREESSLIVIPGFADWKAATSAFVLATSVSEGPARNVIVVPPALPPPLLLPRLPALQPAANSALAVARVTSAAPRRACLLNLIAPPGNGKRTARGGR